MTNVTMNYYKEKMTLTYFLIIIFCLVMLDLALDFFAGMPLREYFFDILLEGTIITTVFAMVRYIWIKFTIEKSNHQNIEIHLKKTQKLANEWELKSRFFMQEFQSFIVSKFEQWSLSKSEKEIAFLLLQGKSSKEIATHRFTSERTIRNQCRTIYEKSNTSGKIELITYFFGQIIGELSF